MVAGTRKLQQLRNVSFPEFFSASISSVQASALVPAGIVLAGLGLAKDDVAAISLSVPSAGSYGIPFIAAHLAFNNAIEHVGPDFWRYTTELKKEYASKCNKDQTASLQLVIEVFAAYAMDVNFTFEKGTAARMQAAINTPANSTRSATLQALTKQISDLQTSATSNSDSSGKGGGDKTTASGTKATTGKKAASGTKAASAADAASAASTPATAGPASEANAGGSQQTQIDQLNTPLNLLVQQAAGFEQQKFAGVSAQIVSGSSSGVRVERVFSNPVVIGYKSMTLLSPDAAQNTTGGQVVEPPDVNVVSTLPSTPTAPTHKNPRSPTRKPVTPSKNRASLNPHAEPQAAASDAVGPAAGRPNGGAAASVPISLGTALAKKGSAAGIPNFPSAATMLDLQ
ncbi:TPA: hypothetical protein ACYLN4_007233 [Burkholderia lata]